MTNLNDETLRQEIIRNGRSEAQKRIDYLLSIFSGEHELAVEILKNRLDRAKLIRETRLAERVK